MNMRLTLGAALAAAGLFAVPSFASATTSCTYDTAKRQVDIQLANPSFGGATVFSVRSSIVKSPCAVKY